MTEFQDPRTGKMYRIDSLPNGVVVVVDLDKGEAMFTAKHKDIATEFEPDECRTCMRWHQWLEDAPT